MKQYKETQYMINICDILSKLDAKADSYVEDIDKMYRSDNLNDKKLIDIYTAIRSGILMAVKLIEIEERVPLNY